MVGAPTLRSESQITAMRRAFLLAIALNPGIYKGLEHLRLTKP
jgi:hypothetical protein